MVHLKVWSSICTWENVTWKNSLAYKSVKRISKEEQVAVFKSSARGIVRRRCPGVAPPDTVLARRESRSRCKKHSVDKPCYTLHWQLLTSLDPNNSQMQQTTGCLWDGYIKKGAKKRGTGGSWTMLLSLIHSKLGNLLVEPTHGNINFRNNFVDFSLQQSFPFCLFFCWMCSDWSWCGPLLARRPIAHHGPH